MENSKNKEFYLWLLLIPFIGVIVWLIILVVKGNKKAEEGLSYLNSEIEDKLNNLTSGNGENVSVNLSNPDGKLSENDTIRLNEGDASIINLNNSQTGIDGSVNSFIFHINDYGENVKKLINTVLDKSFALRMQDSYPLNSSFDLSGIVSYTTMLDEKIKKISNGVLSSEKNNVTIDNIKNIKVNNTTVFFGSGENSSNPMPTEYANGSTSLNNNEGFIYGNSQQSGNIPSGLPTDSINN